MFCGRVAQRLSVRRRMKRLRQVLRHGRNIVIPCLWISGVFLPVYVAGAILLSVLVKRGVVSDRPSTAVYTIASLYTPFFVAVEQIPGADECFARFTSWLAGAER